MRTNKRFSKEFKEAIVKKLISRDNKTIEQFCNENNLAISSVSRWQSECANVLELKKKKDKSKCSIENILKIISETFSLNEEDLGIYLRKNGLHSNQLTEWRSGILPSMNQAKVNPQKKDAALAEVSALLTLQKKSQFIMALAERGRGSLTSFTDRCSILELIAEAVAAGCRRFRACEAFDFEERTIQRWKLSLTDQRRGPLTVPANKISEAERALITGCEWFGTK